MGVRVVFRDGTEKTFTECDRCERDKDKFYYSIKRTVTSEIKEIKYTSRFFSRKVTSQEIVRNETKAETMAFVEVCEVSYIEEVESN
jgi:hypothetical protein